MRNIVVYLLFAILFLGANACNTASNSDNESPAEKAAQEINYNAEDPPIIEFSEEMFDFGTIVQGETVTHIFKFKNTGGSDLLVQKVLASCGCTIPSWTKEPIHPGEEGNVEVIFDSSGRNGLQHKTVTVSSNSKKRTKRLTFTAEIEMPKQ